MSSSLIDSGTILVNRYRIDAYHAAGGMQKVYRAKDLALGREVVVKIPNAGIGDRRFKRGAELSARINHPNIAATLDYYEDQEKTFVVEEFIPGMDLSKRLAEDYEFLDPYLATHVIHNVARSLFEAHKANICHRDIKPSNIMTSPDPGMSTIKLTDFGIAKFAEMEIAAEIELFGRDESTLTTSNTLLGAVPYMAPECWADWKSAGTPMDIWALGCIGIQLLTGVPPFGVGHGAIAAVIRAEHTGIRIGKPVWFNQHPASQRLEDSLWEILLGCLEVDPAKRLTAKEVVIRCNSLCYTNYPRSSGQVTKYGVQYPTGGRGSWGHIVDLNSVARFFHLADFFGGTPQVGQKVCFCSFPGVPLDRCTPVTLMKQ